MGARFFAENFLDAVETFDAQSRTKVLYNVLMQTHKDLRDQLPDPVNQELDQRIPLAVTNQRINVENWLDDLRLEDQVRQQFRDALHAKGLVDGEFELDPQFGERLVRKVYFVGDHEFKITVPYIHMNEIIKSDTTFTDPDGQEWHEIKIHTKAWNKVTR